MTLTLDLFGWRLTIGANPIPRDAPTVDGSGTTSSYPVSVETPTAASDKFGFGARPK